MDFTSLYSHAGPSSTVTSPDDTLLATATLTLLVLRDAESFQVIQSWRIPSGRSFSQLSFSQDSKYLMAADVSDKGPLVHVYSVVLGEKPAAVITPGSEGLQGVRWWDNNISGKRWLACWSRHNLRITVWDLETSRQYHIQSPKRGCEAGWAISPVEADYVAVLERHSGRDHVGLYDLDKLSLMRHFTIETSDACNLAWSPCGKYIAIWESSLEYSLCIYTPTGRMLHRHVLEKQDGPLGLGLKRVAWHPSGRFIALGGFDDKIRILADVNGWRPVAEIDLPGGIFGNTAQSSTQAGRRVHTFTEPASQATNAASTAGITPFESRQHPTFAGAIAYLTGSANGAARKNGSSGSRGISAGSSTVKDMGVEHLVFSPSGRFLVATSASPTSSRTLVLLIRFLRSSPALPYTAIRPRLCSIVKLQSGIKRLAWKPAVTLDGTESLAIVTGQKSILLWNEELPNSNVESLSASDDEADGPRIDGRRDINPGLMECVRIPAKTEFAALDLKWATSGANLILAGQSSFCLAWPLPIQDSA